MSQPVFDDIQLTAMTRAVNQIMRERRGLKLEEVAHAVFMLASETGEFDAGALANHARGRVAGTEGSTGLEY